MNNQCCNAVHNTVREVFYAPVAKALENARAGLKRKCPQCSDLDWMEHGVGRVMGESSCGRAWVRRLADYGAATGVGRFFDALKSARRADLLWDVSGAVKRAADAACPAELDVFAKHAELAGCDIHASDGHCEKASSHTPPVAGKTYPPGCVFALSLRTRSMSVPGIMRPAPGAKKEHDMRALKRLSHERLRLGAPKGRRVLHVYDPACVDCEQWTKWHAKGIYLLSREKDNSAAKSIGEHEVDRKDPRNNGVLSDEIVSVASGRTFRRVPCRDAATGNEFSFITNLNAEVPPGLVAFIYKCRWGIEKSFDQKKNKLFEGKGWGASDVARLQQACFFCLAHNLMQIVDRNLWKEGIRNTKDAGRRKKRDAAAEENIRAQGGKPNSMAIKGSGITQLSAQFIRWLRHHLWLPTPWEAAKTALKPLMAAHLK